MVMADIGDRDRGRRRRKRGGGLQFGRRDYKEDYYEPNIISPGKTPVILSKNQHTTRHAINSYTDYRNGPSTHHDAIDIYSRSPSNDRPPPILLKASHRNDELSEPLRSPGKSSTPGIPSLLSAGEGPPAPSPTSYTIQKPVPNSVHARVVGEGAATGRLPPPPEMTHALKLVDESFLWCESGMEMLLDQTDFLVVGVLGLQGVGKSTILSLLAGNEVKAAPRSLVFRPQSQDLLEASCHQTLGVDMYVSGERTIFLDSQPVLSASVLDYMIHHDKKYSMDYSFAENCVEMQSLQIASFFMTVCNVVLVVMDWFADADLLRFLQTAEMLKPPTPLPGHDGQKEEDHFPQIVFLLNKAESQDFDAMSYQDMQDTIARTLGPSKLLYKDGPSMATSNLIHGLDKTRTSKNINLFTVPRDTHGEQREDEDGLRLLHSYIGHPSFDRTLRTLRNQLLAMPRRLLAHTTLSEKNWFHYASRTWEALRKSQLFSEYNRLLP